MSRGVAEVERQILDDEEVVCRSPGVASESVVLEPYAGVGVPVVPRYVSRSADARMELRVTDALTKGPWTPLVRDQLRSRSSSLSWCRPRPRSS
jgi:hypothetical protein